MQGRRRPWQATRLVRHYGRRAAWVAVPLALRKPLAIWLDRAAMAPSTAMMLVRDLAETDTDSYHRFLWSNHLGYAHVQESTHGFGPNKLSANRRQFFGELITYLRGRGIDPARDVKSVLEVGCSQGYLLRFVETDLFPSATDIFGVDIDKVAIENGRRFLERQGSKIRLHCADVTNLERVLGNKTYDVILCAGVLLYCKEETAQAVVESMIRRARIVVAIAEPAHPEMDNAGLAQSEQRPWEGDMIHNVDAMVERAGGHIHCRRWHGGPGIGGQRVHFVFGSRVGSGDRRLALP